MMEDLFFCDLVFGEYTGLYIEECLSVNYFPIFLEILSFHRRRLFQFLFLLLQQKYHRCQFEYIVLMELIFHQMKNNKVHLTIKDDEQRLFFPLYDR